MIKSHIQDKKTVFKKCTIAEISTPKNFLTVKDIPKCLLLFNQKLGKKVKIITIRGESNQKSIEAKKGNFSISQ